MRLQGYRLVQARYASIAFDGEGARRFGGRWNHKGTALVYTAQSLSLAALELLVHLDSRQVLEERYLSLRVEFPEELCGQAAVWYKLPKNWMADPAPDSVKQIGSLWAKEGRSAILAVPSVLIPKEWNYLINPQHPDFAKISLGKPERFRFDPRLAR